jgi:hypothetical protein
MANKNLDSAQAEAIREKKNADLDLENDTSSEEADPTHGHTEEGETACAMKCQDLLKNWA